MSYCRWSSDDHQCDVYVYNDVGGWWQTYVAGRKRRLRDGVTFPPPAPLSADPHGWYERYKRVSEIISAANEGVLWDWVDLPSLPDGASFRDATPGECADRLETLRAAGFNVPQYAIDELREEAKCEICHGTGEVEGQIPNRYDSDYLDDVPLVCPECEGHSGA